MVESRDGRQLRTPANPRQLHHGTHHAGTHKQKHLEQWDVEGILAEHMSSLMVGDGHLVIGNRYHPPHADRNQNKQKKRKRAMDRVQAFAKFADLLSYPVTPART